VRRILLLALTVATALISPHYAHAQSQDLQSFEQAVPRIAPNTAIAGTIAIPRLGVRAAIYEGVTMTNFAKGVGQWPGTPRPGQRGNIVLGGHRTSGKKPFANIDKLVPGDIITLTTRGLTYRYSVTESLIVKPTDIWITDPTKNATLTLFACHPKGKTTQRYVVRAALVQ